MRRRIFDFADSLKGCFFYCRKGADAVWEKLNYSIENIICDIA